MRLNVMIAGATCILLGICTSQSFAQTKKTATKTVAKKTTTVAKVAPKPFATPQEIEEGKTLISKSDCLACHNVDAKLVGPSYSSIAQKYPQDQATVAALSEKVAKGGSGVWGTVPMTPHPALASADINKMVAYVLSLKK
ncbi:c-type cytochrome [Mucilaginibacter sp. RS28]|uniref:C-type cytochrome n=1 Tax=Mucilaginibacter straminoryzae TaxID=2932774 RepID=A0A9X2B8H1_9SPHI|nr:c-type cytochrome [Mucilaginibacter straminoryzae]MCJ8209609.1 c-type cytochrome [Mucilaginibacter straminoryzae]